MLVRIQCIDILVIDSRGSTGARAEISGRHGRWSVGLQARLMSQTEEDDGRARGSGDDGDFINQLREKIGDVRQSRPTTDDKALKFYTRQCI